MKIAAREIKSLLAQPSPAYMAYLLHGPDRGLVRERAHQLAAHFVDKLDDPFAVEQLAGSAVKGDPAILADALSALPAFGGMRLVMLSGAGGELTEAVKNAAEYLHPDARLIIQASDVNTRHALVKFCDAAKPIASIACYPDENRDIASLAREVFARDEIQIDQAALALLVSRLGADRGSSRSEIDKLAVMAGPKGVLTEEDIAFGLGDSAAQAIDTLILALGNGQIAPFEEAFARAKREEFEPIAILRQAQNHFKMLSFAKSAMQNGQSVQQVVASLRPPVHFRTKPHLTSQLARLPMAHIIDCLGRLAQLETDIKSGGAIDSYVRIGQGLLGICLRSHAYK